MTTSPDRQRHITASSPEPILASWKISEVLRQYPQLLDVLVDLSPAFSKLRNPVLRRVQGRLVTVAQAAGIAGLEPAHLTRELNRAIGTAAPDTAEATRAAAPSKAAPPAWLETAPLVRELDVRPILARGEEPFRAIMDAARTVTAGERLRLLVGFEPLPLYDALGKQGFRHWAVKRDADTWQVDFLRDRAAARPVAPAASGGGTIEWEAPAAEVTIDVSELVPPEPMIKILQTLETLPADARLLVHHVRRPIHLYDQLNEMGYAHETRDIAPGQVEVMIQKRPVPGEQA